MCTVTIIWKNQSLVEKYACVDQKFVPGTNLYRLESTSGETVYINLNDIHRIVIRDEK